jgi:hypothetical protein
MHGDTEPMTDFFATARRPNHTVQARQLPQLRTAPIVDTQPDATERLATKGEIDGRRHCRPNLLSNELRAKSGTRTTLVQRGSYFPALGLILPRWNGFDALVRPTGAKFPFHHQRPGRELRDVARLSHIIQPERVIQAKGHLTKLR